jgi:hypothetical protein
MYLAAKWKVAIKHVLIYWTQTYYLVQGSIWNFFFNFVKTLTEDYMFKVGWSRFMGIIAKFTVYFIAFK